MNNSPPIFCAAGAPGLVDHLRVVTAYADGRGKTLATTHPIVGLDNVMQLHASLAPVFAEKTSRLMRYGFINGVPRFVSIEQDDIRQTTALQIEDGKLVAFYVTRNPDKVRHLSCDAVQ